MKEFILEKTHDFVDGGCNACPTVRCDNYVLVDGENRRVLESLDCQSMIQEMAIMEGFTLKYLLDMGEDVLLFEQMGKTIQFFEEYGYLTYQNVERQKKVKNRANNLSEILPVVNDIRVTIFEIEACTLKERTLD